jgi:hypothetical protein
VRLGGVDYERLWPRLIEFLNGWCVATELTPDRIEVRLPSMGGGAARVVEIVMTREEWDEWVSVAWGAFKPAAQQVRDTLLRLGPGQEFLVYGQYELVASPTPELPEDKEMALMEELARKHPKGFGRWVQLDGENNVVDEFRPPPD